MSAFDVIIDDAATVSEPISPLAYMGLAFGAVIGLLSLYRLIRAIGSETGATEAEGVI